MKNKVGILYICTGKYDVFWKDFFKTCEKFFLPTCEKEYYVFTDSEKIYGEEESKRIHKIYQENLGWPDNTLKRFNIFNNNKEKFMDNDYLFFMNANIKFIKKIESEEFLPENDSLLVVKHPGFYDKKNEEFSYDRNKESLAYIPKGDGDIYVQGALNGGTSKSFINLINTLDRNVELDLEKKIIALWHDESHLNKYILGRKDIKVLGPEYLYPEGEILPFEAKIITRNKSEFGGHANLRGVKKNNMAGSIRRIIKKILER